jgi:Flp pilus assembly pilin Flp
MRRLLREEEGQASVEYGLLAVLISVVAVGAIGDIGIKAAQFFQDLLNAWP